jgi:hypothetical protein
MFPAHPASSKTPVSLEPASHFLHEVDCLTQVLAPAGGEPDTQMRRLPAPGRHRQDTGPTR